MRNTDTEDMGYRDTDLCDCLQPDSASHMIWHCDYAQHFVRQIRGSESILQFVDENPHLPLWHTAIIPHPAVVRPAPTTDNFMFWEVEADETVGSLAFGDGSGKLAHLSKNMRRCGWSVFAGHYEQSTDPPILVENACGLWPLPTLVKSTPTPELCFSFV